MEPADPQLNESRLSEARQRAMNLTFRLEQDDLAQFAKAASARNGSGNPLVSLPVLLASSLILGIVVLAILYFLQLPLLSNAWFYVSLALGVALLVVFLQAFSSAQALAPSLEGPTLGRRVYEIEGEGLIITQDGIQQAWMWQSIQDVQETDDAVYLFVDKNAAHIFPKNVFASPVHAREFAAYMREKVALAGR